MKKILLLIMIITPWATQAQQPPGENWDSLNVNLTFTKHNWAVCLAWLGGLPDEDTAAVTMISRISTAVKATPGDSSTNVLVQNVSFRYTIFFYERWKQLPSVVAESLGAQIRTVINAFGNAILTRERNRINRQGDILAKQLVRAGRRAGLLALADTQ